jgi:hypothetical protein
MWKQEMDKKSLLESVNIGDVSMELIELVEEVEGLLEEVKKLSWMIGINNSDLLALLLKIQAEKLTKEDILAELKKKLET